MAPPGGADSALEDSDWEYMIVFIQKGVGTSRAEILRSPLIPLNSTFINLQKIWQEEISGRMAGMLGGSPAVEPDKKKNAIFGETPQFQSRDEYFKWVDQHRGG